MYIVNDISMIIPQTWDKAVFIYMNNMSLHFNDYEEKSVKIRFKV